MKELAITVKPTLACNMKCKHCFNGDAFKTAAFIDLHKILVLFFPIEKYVFGLSLYPVIPL